MSKTWKDLVAQHLGIDVDLAILEANDFLMKQIEVLLKIIEKNKVKLQYTDEDRRQLSEIAAKLDPQKREKYSLLVKPETLLVWHRKLIGKLTQSKQGKRNGYPPITDRERELIIRMARENPDWGLARISGELEKSGYKRCATTVKNVLRNEGIEPPPLKCRPKGTWKRFMDAHSEIWQVDFAVHNVLNIFNHQVTPYFIQLFINIKTREVILGGITAHPNEEWMKQSARNISGFEMENADLLIRDNDKIYQDSFDDIFEANGTTVAKTSPGSPDMNSFIERFILSLKSECLNHLMLFSRKQLEYAVREYIEFYNTQRPHQGLENEIPRPSDKQGQNGEVVCLQRLGGLLKSYERVAA